LNDAVFLDVRDAGVAGERGGSRGCQAYGESVESVPINVMQAPEIQRFGFAADSFRIIVAGEHHDVSVRDGPTRSEDVAALSGCRLRHDERT
jgi:hypothetical protein